MFIFFLIFISRESLFNLLSALYALLLVVIGAVLPVAEVFAEPVASGGFEVSVVSNREGKIQKQIQNNWFTILD